MKLVVVIVTLAILTAIALPNLMSARPDARVAALKSLSESLISGSSLANARCRSADGCFNSGWASEGIASPDGLVGRMYNGYPTANANSTSSHITRWVNVSGFTVDTSSNLFTDFIPDDASVPQDCKLRYTGAQFFGEPPAAELTTSGC